MSVIRDKILLPHKLIVLPKCNLDKNNKANKVYNTQWRNTLWEKESGTVQKKSQQ